MLLLKAMALEGAMAEIPVHLKSVPVAIIFAAIPAN